MKTIKIALAVLTFVANASAEKRAVEIPALSGQKTPLQLRVVGYHGGTNGELTVEVSNPTAAAAEFNAQGLYFVPDENANNAPQRLGAVGPFRSRSDGKWRPGERISVPASGAVTLKLDVYCIDSHRRSPTSGDKFRLARSRMPAQLARKIDSTAKKAAEDAGGFFAPRAKSAVQSEVWKARDAKWLKLEGEGRQEAGK